MDSCNESDGEPISTQMLEDIFEGSNSLPSVNSREARNKIRDSIKQRKLDWKGTLFSTQNMGKVLHKVFNLL